MSTLNVSNITDGTTTVGTSYVVNGSAKAWSNFDGTGTIALRDSFNVASLTDIGTGQYRTNFTSSMANANYSANMTDGEYGNISGANPEHYAQASNFATTSVTANSRVTTGGASDVILMTTAVLGDLA